MASLYFWMRHLRPLHQGIRLGAAQTFFISRAVALAAPVIFSVPAARLAQASTRIALKEPDPFVIKIGKEILEDLRTAPASLRLSHLVNLADVQIKLGDFSGARSTVLEARGEPSLLQPPGQNDLKKLVDLSIDLDDSPSLLAWIERLPVDAQIPAVGAYGVAMAHKHDTAAATGMAERLETIKEMLLPDVTSKPARPLSSDRIQTDVEFLNLGREFALSGAIAPAEGIIAKLDSPIRQIQLLGIIARQQRQVGTLEASGVTLQRMHDLAVADKGFGVLSEAIVAYATCGDFKHVIALITELPEPRRPGTLSAAARQFLKDNDPLSILEIAKAGDLDDAILAKAADVAFRAGHIGEANQLADIALGSAKRTIDRPTKNLAEELDKIPAFVANVDATIAVHRFTEATETILSLPANTNIPQSKIVALLNTEIEAKDKAAIDATLKATLKLVGAPGDPTINGFLGAVVNLAKAGYGWESHSILDAVTHYTEIQKGVTLVNDLELIRACLADTGDQDAVKRLTTKIEAANQSAKLQKSNLPPSPAVDPAMMAQINAALAALDAPNDGSDAALIEAIRNALAAVHQNGPLLQSIFIMQSMKQTALRNQALDLAEDGHLGEAVSLALTLNGLARNVLLQNLAEKQIKAGNFNAAYDIDEKIPAAAVRGYALITLLSAMAATK